MAANVQITPGTGDVVAAEDISNVKYQKIKLFDATASSTAATGVAANPLQVSLANHGANATPVLVDLGAADTLGTVTTVGTVSTVTTVGTVSACALPTGASTAAKQPALGTAGTASADVITVQGVASMTPILATVTATNLDVRDLTSASDSVAAVCTNGGTFAVQAACTLGAETTKVIGAVNVAASQTIAVTNVTASNLNCTEASASAIKTAVEVIDNAISGSEMQVDVVAALPAGTNLIGNVDVAPRATGGWSVMNATSGDAHTALTGTAQVIKASAGKFGGYYIMNPNAAASYVHVYNIAAASVTVGTSTALLNFCIPAGAAANIEFLAGIAFDTAMSWAATTTGGGNTNPTTALEAMCWFI